MTSLSNTIEQLKSPDRLGGVMEQEGAIEQEGVDNG